ncbi:MAG TPA: histidine--tRNA ligase [Devosiaceae bacterium]|jgi:histidyl-tRNA synthetase
MTDKSQLISPRVPRGFEDRMAPDIAATEAMVEKIKAVYRRYGFDPVETPFFEYTEALGKFLPDTDRPNAGVFSLQDDDEQWMSLRYDLTAPLARHFAENYDRLPKPYRSYRAGYVFRNEKPGPGRFRQFMQFDADTVGAAGPEADAEMCMMMADTMDALGLAGKYVVKVNNRKVLDGVLAAAGVTADAQKLTVLRAIDKLDKFGIEGVTLLLGKGRKDESGDFTKGAELDQNQIAVVLDYIGGRAAADNAGVVELGVMQALFDSAGYKADRIKIDPAVVRGLEYYTGPVFEIELTFEVTNEKGQPVVFGSVGGGGRYDGLVSRFRSEPVPATGFSIGVSRLAQALKLTGNLPAEESSGLVVVLVLDRDQTARYQSIVSRLRQAGIRAEMYLGSSGMNAQMKYANRRNAAAVVIEGSNEREAGEVTVKDLVAGAEAAKGIADNAEWKAARPGQFTCKDAELVDRLAEIPAIRAWLDANNP